MRRGFAEPGRMHCVPVSEGSSLGLNLDLHLDVYLLARHSRNPPFLILQETARAVMLPILAISSFRWRVCVPWAQSETQP